MSKDLFWESLLIVHCTLEKKINAIILVDTYPTGYSFINGKFAEIIYQIFEIEPQHLTKSKLI